MRRLALVLCLAAGCGRGSSNVPEASSPMSLFSATGPHPCAYARLWFPDAAARDRVVEQLPLRSMRA